ncbi:MAG: signal peptidase I [Terriglobales bacterium]
MNQVRTELSVETVAQEPNPSGPHRPARNHAGGMNSLQSLAITIVIAVFVIAFIVQAFQIPSPSMEKTLLVGDYLLVDKAHDGHSAFWRWLMPYQPVRRQDIIVFRYPLDPRQHFVKRVVAVPGDRVRLIDKHVYVDEVRQDDTYATFHWEQRDGFRDNFPDGNLMVLGMSSPWYLQIRKLLEEGDLIVPEGSFFVLGDNRDDSSDSRYWGFVPAENIVGRPLVIYWSVLRSASAAAGSPPSDKLSSLAYDVAHMLHDVRWRRMLRTVQ